jgi:hypothetical protein
MAGSSTRTRSSASREVLDFKHIKAVSDPMRELIEDLWPELANKLPPKAN